MSKLDSGGDALLRLRIFLLVAAPLILPIAFTIFFVPARQARSLREEATKKAEAITQLFATNAVSAIFVEDPTGLEALLVTARADPDVVYAAGFGKDGKPVALFKSREIKPALQTARAGGGAWEDGDLLHVAAAVKVGDQLVGYIQAGFSLEKIHAQASAFRVTAIVLTVVILVIAALIALVLGRGFARLFAQLRHSMLQTARQVDEVVNLLAAVTAQQTSAASEESSALHESNATAADVGQAATLSAQRANQLIERGARAEEGASSGLRSVESAIQGMRQVREQMATIGKAISALSERASAIGDIASTVAVLAERTNLLALNAAIEAARAGAQGRGFSVVAQEMRSLADGSNRSAGQVKAIIAEIQAAIARAVGDAGEGERRAHNAESLADEAGAAIRKFVEVTSEFARAGQEIATSATQQSTAIEQMVESIGLATQAGSTQLETTRQVEETARQLRQLSQQMLRVVAGGDTGQAVNGAVPRAQG